MKCYWLILSGICLAGCMANKGLQTDAVSETNRYRLSRVRKGMYEAQVLQIMRQPYKYETFEIGENVFDIWFYVTYPTVLAQSRMVAQNLTPLTFKDGVLVGTGYDYYYFVTREMAKQQAAETPPPPKTPPVQPRPAPSQAPVNTPIPQHTKPASDTQTDKDLERTLQKAAQPTSSPQTPDRQTPPPAPNKQGSLQPSPQPTAPIFSSTTPPIKMKNFASIYAAKNPISKIQKGMSEDEVQAIMGEPVDSQTYELGEDVYDVWFYEAASKRTADNRTPLTFKNGRLVGMTTDYYNGIKQAATHDQIEGYDKKGERMQQGEAEQDFDYW